jgi:hypothetical protein
MRHNEQPVQLRASCTPSAENPYFFRPAELERCLG